MNRRITMGRITLGRTILYAVLLALCLLQVGPFIWAIQTSLSPLEDAFTVEQSGHAEQLVSDAGLTGQYYADVFKTLPFGRYLLNSLIISLSGTIGAVLTSAMAGYALARLPIRFKGVWFGLLIASMMMPTQILLLSHFLMFESLGWFGTYKPLIVPAWLGGGAFNVFLFRQAFRSISREVEEAALTDGATRWQFFTRILLPMSRPTVVVVAILSFVFHWQSFLYPLIYLSDFETFPVSVGLRMYQTLAGTWVNELMAASVIAMIPVVLVFAIGQRWIVGVERRSA